MTDRKEIIKITSAGVLQQDLYQVGEEVVPFPVFNGIAAFHKYKCIGHSLQINLYLCWFLA